MSDDRNEGECYGPFHAGFVCRECADSIRALESEKAALEARVRELEAENDVLDARVSLWGQINAALEAWKARAEKAEKERDQQERFKWAANQKLEDFIRTFAIQPSAVALAESLHKAEADLAAALAHIHACPSSTHHAFLRNRKGAAR